MADGEDVQKLMTRMASTTAEIGAEAYKRAGPMVKSFTESATGLVNKTVDKVQQYVGAQPNRNPPITTGSTIGSNHASGNDRDGNHSAGTD